MIIGIGIDLVEVDRLKKSVEKFGDRFLNRLFTENEIKYCQTKSNSYQHFAVRFAAKEALLKAIGTGLREGMTWHEIEIINDKQGKPSILTHGKCDDILHKLDVRIPELSLSHTKHHGVAVVILEQHNG
jgi:holo-[acyl-carrier protein] synthase